MHHVANLPDRASLGKGGKMGKTERLPNACSYCSCIEDVAGVILSNHLLNCGSQKLSGMEQKEYLPMYSI
jgi:hypothetical protein